MAIFFSVKEYETSTECLKSMLKEYLTPQLFSRPSNTKFNNFKKKKKKNKSLSDIPLQSQNN